MGDLRKLRYAVVALTFALIGAVLLPVNQARANEEVPYMGVRDTERSTPQLKQADLTANMAYYGAKEPPVSKETLTEVYALSIDIYRLWGKLEISTADLGANPHLQSFKEDAIRIFQWVDSVGRGDNAGLTGRNIGTFRDALAGKVKTSSKNVVKKIVTDLEAKKPSVDPEKQTKYQKVLDKLKAVADSEEAIHLEDAELAEYIGLGNELVKNPNAEIRIPGEPTEDPEKQPAQQALTEKIAELDLLLKANPENTQNLSAEEKRALETAKKTAQDVLDAAASKNTQELKEATTAADQALQKANSQIGTNKQQAKKDLNTAVEKAQALAGASDLPETNKQKLNSAIQAANKVKDGESTVKQLEEAKTTLEQAYREAEQAKNQALANEAQAKEAAKQELAGKIAEIERTLNANPAEAKNLKEGERSALEQAKAEAQKVLEAVESKTAEELKQASGTAGTALEKATGQITTNKETAKSALGEKVTEATNLVDSLPESAKQDLRDAITAANRVKDNPASTVKELEAAKSTLEAAITKAKEAAKQNLTDKIAELEKALKENPAESQNLSVDERQALEQAKRDAQAVLADVDNKNSRELGQATAAADQALQTANTAITENKNTAKGVLDSEITKAEEIAGEEGIPTEAKIALDESIAAAKKVTTDNTVSEINAAKQALETAVANAETAKTKAEHAAAKAELAAKLAGVNEVLKANPEASKNLGEAERAELEKAKANLEALLENADSKPASEFKEAGTQADTALEAAKANITDNQGNAKEKLAAAISEATKVSEDKDLPAEAKKALDEAIAKAEAVKEDPNASVAVIEEASAQLAEAKEQATKVRDEAVAAKEAAKKALGDKIAEIDKVLNHNPEAGKNLSAAERQALEAAKTQAEAMLKAADTKPTDEVNAATAEADQALNQAKDNVAKNQDISRKELLAALAQAKALSEAPLLPAEAKKALDEAIAKAQAAYDDPAAPVATLEEAKEALHSAYQAAEAALNRALAEEFRQANADTLAKTLEKLTLGDSEKVEVALREYSQLGSEVQQLLAAEKAHLDVLVQRLELLKQEEARKQVPAAPKQNLGDLKDKGDGEQKQSPTPGAAVKQNVAADKLSNTGADGGILFLLSVLLVALGAVGVSAKRIS